jgi:basic amino acid/polyamine antiporter, APA family
VVLAAAVDIRGAIGFSSFGVLVYYAIANAAAWTLSPCRGPAPAHHSDRRSGGMRDSCGRATTASVITGAVVIAVGAVVYGLRRAVLK